MNEDSNDELKALLSSPLIAGPDPSVVDDLDPTDDQDPNDDLDPTQELFEQSELDRRVEEIYQQIIKRAPEHQVQPSISRVEACLELMGNPQRAYRAIHITGTNGKTSTARIVEALLRERGLRTGRFTSPHLNSVRERISIDGHAISPADFVQAWEDVEPFIAMVDEKSKSEGGPQMSFFEVFTVMAYSAFAMAPVDVAVVEVGMGGRWDATNVIDADVAVLMTVAADHEKWLGYELTDIASEKLGIVKEGATLVSARQTDDVRDLVLERVREQKATLIEAGPKLQVLARETAVGGQMITVQTPSAIYEDIPLAMLGAYQADNAAVALAAVESLFGGGALSAEVVEHALMSTTSPGRLEVAKSSPLIIIDAAHNPAGAVATRQALEEYFPGPRVAVFSALEDKNVDGILAELEPAFEAIVVTEIDSVRAMSTTEIADIATDVFGEERVSVEENLAEAISRAVDLAETADPNAIAPASVVVIGSIMLAAEARKVLGVSKPDNA